MAVFQYSALDPSGKSLSGTIEANHMQEAISKLKGMGYFVTSVSPVKFH